VELKVRYRGRNVQLQAALKANLPLDEEPGNVVALLVIVGAGEGDQDVTSSRLYGGQMSTVRNVDQLRAAIDSGRSGDKVAASDPAAAPLGTDEEAGGNPPTRDQVAMARRHEVGRPVSSPPIDRAGLGQGWWIIAVTVVIGVCVVAAPLFLK
jgi:hypothetical protein